MSEKKNLVSSAKSLFFEIKTHWNEPKEGFYVPYKEYLSIFFGVGSNYAGSKVLEYVGFWSSCFLIMHHYNIPYLAFSVIGLINMPLNYIWTLIWWVVCDNLGFLKKKTEIMLYSLYFSLVAIGLGMIIGDMSLWFDQSSSFIITLNNLEGISASSAFKILGTHILYNGWVGARNIFYRKKLIPKYGRYKYCLYSDVIPKIITIFLIGWLPVYNIPDIDTRVWVANLLFAVYNMFGFANQLEICSKSISPNLKERLYVRTYPVKLSHFLNTILTFAIPISVGLLKDGWADINMFRYVIPFTFSALAVLTLFTAKSVQERIPQPPLEKKVNIDFWGGIFGVLKNKYLLINTVVNLIDALGNGMLPFVTVIYFYTFRLEGLAYSLIVTLISFAGTPPDFFAPVLLKKFSYKQIMIFYQLTRALGNALIVCAIVFCGENLTLCGTICCVVMFLMEMTKTIPTTAGHDMGVRIADYQMYLSGERLESFTGIFGWFTGPITSFIGLIIPLMLLKFGFNSNWDILYVDHTRAKIIAIPLIIDIIGFTLMTIPYFFWDYGGKEQNMVMQVLNRRAEVTERKAKEAGETVSGGFVG